MIVGASAAKLASPTPTTARAASRLQNPQASPLANVAALQIAMPSAIRPLLAALSARAPNSGEVAK